MTSRAWCRRHGNQTGARWRQSSGDCWTRTQCGRCACSSNCSKREPWVLYSSLFSRRRCRCVGSLLWRCWSGGKKGIWPVKLISQFALVIPKGSYTSPPGGVDLRFVGSQPICKTTNPTARLLRTVPVYCQRVADIRNYIAGWQTRYRYILGHYSCHDAHSHCVGSAVNACVYLTVSMLTVTVSLSLSLSLSPF